LKGLLDNVLQSGRLLIYIDEAHIHLDTDEGYGWSVKGERAWVSSSSPGLRKVSFYGVYIYNLGQVRIFPYDKAEKFNTIDVLKHLRTEFPDNEMTVIWDGASYHRAALVQQAAKAMDIPLQPLSGYSPDFMPVEHLWQWLREDVTYHICHNSEAELIERVSAFEQAINAFPLVLADRLWVKTHLKTEEEKLRVST
jgi:transposase